MNYKIFILFIISIFIFSCSPQKRIIRICSKHPEACKTDTLKIIDSFFTKYTEIDTQFIFNNEILIDTFIVFKDRLKIQYIKRFDTIKIKAECLSDTIIVTKEIYKNLIIPKKTKTFQNIKPYLICLFILIFLIVIYHFLKIFLLKK